MQIIHSYSHLGGKEILQARFPKIYEDIHSVIKNIPKIDKNKKSKEKTKNGKMLYSPREINNLFKKMFNEKGFNEIRDSFEITLPSQRIKKETVTSYKQIDFEKNKVLIEVQLGKYAFMFYDMAKFQYFFNENKAEVGVEIVPCYSLQQEMSTGVSYGEQLIFDIDRLRRHFPSVPIYLILIDI